MKAGLRIRLTGRGSRTGIGAMDIGTSVTELHVAPATGGEGKNLTQSLDRDIVEIPLDARRQIIAGDGV